MLGVERVRVIFWVFWVAAGRAGEEDGMDEIGWKAPLEGRYCWSAKVSEEHGEVVRNTECGRY